VNKIYKFSEFVLDRQAPVLYRRNIPVQLSSRAFQILVRLIERRGEVVEKEELLNRV
jgi:DNA-binding winged helix-turn-helix (wHTH) protein